MQIHIHNRLDDAAAPLTRAEWDAVAQRLSFEATLSIGSDARAFHARAPNIEVLVSSPKGVRDLLPFDAPRLRLLFVTWAGLDRLAPYDWVPPDVVVLNSSGAHALKAAEYVVMGLLMMKNGMAALARAQADRTWSPAVGRTLAGRHLVIIGLGAIGGATATLARRLGMRVTGVRSTPRPHPDCDAVVGVDGLDSLLLIADFVALALPQSPATDRLLDRRRLSLLPAHAGIVNVGRGRTLDETALCDLLDAGRIAAAVLDVFESEPLPPDHPLWSSPNLIISPHVAGSCGARGRERLADFVAENVGRFVAGQAVTHTVSI